MTIRPTTPPTGASGRYWAVLSVLVLMFAAGCGDDGAESADSPDSSTTATAAAPASTSVAPTTTVAKTTAEFECDGAQWHPDGHEMVTAGSPSEAVSKFENAAAAEAADGEDVFSPEEWQPEMEIAIDSATSTVKLTNIPSKNGASDSYNLTWKETPSGYDFTTIETTDQSSQIKTGLSAEIAPGAYAPISAAALVHSYGVARGHSEDGEPLIGEAAVWPFTVGEHAGVTLAFWSDGEGGQILICQNKP